MTYSKSYFVVCLFGLFFLGFFLLHFLLQILDCQLDWLCCEKRLARSQGTFLSHLLESRNLRTQEPKTMLSQALQKEYRLSLVMKAVTEQLPDKE